MQYPLFVPGFEHHDVDIVPSGFLRGPQLLFNGIQAPKGPRRNQYVLTRSDGSKVLIQLKPTLFDPVPKVLVDDELIEVVEPLSTFKLIWSGIALLMIFFGGALGGLIGGAAYWTNILVFRSEMSSGEKYILTALISGIAVVLYLLVSAIFSALFFT